MPPRSSPPALRLPHLALIAVLAALAPRPGLAEATCPAGTSAADMVLPATERALLAGRPLTIVAFGSSSTEGSGASAADQTYPARLEARLRKAMPGVPLRVINHGRGGEDVSQMLDRLQADVLAEAPTLVVWQAGANAMLKGMAPDAFRTAMEAGLARLRGSGADVVLMDNQRAPRILGNPNHAAFEVTMAELASANHLPLFSRSALMQQWEAEGAPAAEFLGGDGLHHNDHGYDCVAAALTRSLVAALHRPALVAGGP